MLEVLRVMGGAKGAGAKGAMSALLLLVLGAETHAQAPAAPSREGVITGQVVDAASGKPVSAAIVSIAGGGIVVAPGRGDGSLDFRADPGGGDSFSMHSPR